MEAVPRWPTLGALLRNSFARKNILGIFCWKITMSLKSLTSLQSLMETAHTHRAVCVCMGSGVYVHPPP